MIAELFLIMDLLKGTVQTNGTPSLPSTGSEVSKLNPFKKKEKVIKGVLDEPGTAFGELKFKKYF
jgi:hypothetical protein|tara:strand:- start:486 stop:680 length:195 start_codon:yes stop_codon:yes gene_type:complete